MKALYKHKSGDIFAIETDDKGKVLSTSGPLLSKDLNPKMLDYDDYWFPAAIPKECSLLLTQ